MYVIVRVLYIDIDIWNVKGVMELGIKRYYNAIMCILLCSINYILFFFLYNKIREEKGCFTLQRYLHYHHPLLHVLALILMLLHYYYRYYLSSP